MGHSVSDCVGVHELTGAPNWDIALEGVRTGEVL